MWMEFELLEVHDLDDIRSILEIASQENHKNSVNYSFKEFKKRWKNYCVFHKLVDHTLGGTMAISGLYKYHDKLARVIDRTWVHPYYRSSFLNRNNNMIVRPAIDYFIPTQTQYCQDRGMVSFISVQYPEKTRVLERLIRETNCGYNLLPDTYFTCQHDNRDNMRCWQRCIATGEIDLPKLYN